MNTLAAQLFQAGLVSREKLTRHEAVEEVRAMNETSKTYVTSVAFVALEDCTSMGEFKQYAKKALLEDPTRIGHVVKLAHQFKGERPENKKFIAFFYILRDRLEEVSPDKHRELIQRAFRRHGATFDVSE